MDGNDGKRGVMTDLRKFQIWIHPILFQTIMGQEFDQAKVRAETARLFPADYKPQTH